MSVNVVCHFGCACLVSLVQCASEECTWFCTLLRGTVWSKIRAVELEPCFGLAAAIGLCRVLHVHLHRLMDRDSMPRSGYRATGGFDQNLAEREGWRAPRVTHASISKSGEGWGRAAWGLR